ncbi:uncharacterized protein LOC111042894 [Myzus persicae]|uniref:uncharacterized protein LOC111042894 n=1 Tax=Myzus persicae TaxID=13164 RepID=UPI000B936F1D|nr:uncharacterized protein LOC111042894 [Myzus persicae]
MQVNCAHRGSVQVKAFLDLYNTGLALDLSTKQHCARSRKPAKRSKKVKKSKKSNTTKNASPKPALRKTDKISNIIPNINPHSKLLADKLHNIAVPHNLQKALFLDFVMNNTFQNILTFPEKHFLAEIVYAFTQSTYFDDDSEKKSSTMLCVTLMQYFNSYVSKHLLYVNEKRFKLYRNLIVQNQSCEIKHVF